MVRREIGFRQNILQWAGWLVHGLLWAFFHAFKYWDVLSLLPICLLISFTSARLKNNRPGLIAHAQFNGGSLLVIFLVL